MPSRRQTTIWTMPFGFRGQREVVNFMTKMTCDQEHRTQLDTTCRHKGISDSHTDENNVIDVKKIFQQSWNFHQKYPNDYEIFIRMNTGTLMFEVRTFAVSIFIHIWPYCQPTSVRCKQDCTIGVRVTCEVGRFAWKSKSMYVIWSANFENQFYSEIQV